MGRRKNKKSNRIRWIYAAGALGMAALISAAFYVPQLIFGMQDNIRCRDYQFDRQEVLDTTLLSTTYEPSLYNRLLRLAEDEQAGVQLYVTAQELTPDDTLYDFLYSGQGMEQNKVVYWMDRGLFPYDMFYMCQIVGWKQYVIYSDNYKEGVNFIIWYLELETPEGVRLRLLLDGESGDLYALQSDYTDLKENEKYAKARVHAESIEYIAELLGVSLTKTEMAELWLQIACIYCGYSDEEITLYDTYLYSVIYDYDNSQGTETNEVNSVDKDDTYYDMLTRAYVWHIAEESGELEFSFPYGKYSQSFKLCIAGNIGFYHDLLTCNVTVGFSSIYEKIPEFAEHLSQ